MPHRKKPAKEPQIRGVALRDRLLAACRELLAENRPEKITSNMVLDRASVARNTLYHHFKDMSALLRAAMVAEFSEYFAGDVVVLKKILKSSTTRAQFRNALQQVTAQSQGEERRNSRYARARVITYCARDAVMAPELAAAQQRLTAELEDFVDRAQDRGWVRRDIESRVIAVFLQSYTLGKIIDDLVPDPVPAANWNALINKIVMDGLLEPEDSPAKKYGATSTKKTRKTP